MSIVDRLLFFLKKSPQSETPDGFCPNCWGRAEYAGKFYEAVNNIDETDPQVGWIQDYANKHLLDIELTKADGDLACPKCKMQYKPAL